MHSESSQPDEVEGVLLGRKEVLLQRAYTIWCPPSPISNTSCRLQTETKESKWDMPDELLLLLEKVEKEGKATAPPASALVYVTDSFSRSTSP